METDAGPRRVLHDALAAEPAAGSPIGDRVVYAAVNPDFDSEPCGDTPKTFLSCQVLRRIRLEGWI